MTLSAPRRPLDPGASPADGASFLDRASAANVIDYFRSLGSHPEGRAEQLPRFGRFAAPVAHPYFNLVHSFATPAAPEPLAPMLEEALAPFRSAGRPLLWLVFPGLDPQSPRLVAALEQAGLRLCKSYRGMLAELDSLPEEAPPEGLEIARVTDAEAMREWLALQQEARDDLPRQDAGLAEARLLGAAWQGFSPQHARQHYLARLRGRPAGIATLHLGAGLAGLYHVATLPAQRRQGIGRAITLHALHEGRRRGCATGVLHVIAPPGDTQDRGSSRHSGLGLVARGQVQLFIWRPPAV